VYPVRTGHKAKHLRMSGGQKKASAYFGPKRAEKRSSLRPVNAYLQFSETLDRGKPFPVQAVRPFLIMLPGRPTRLQVEAEILSVAVQGHSPDYGFSRLWRR